MSEEGMKFTQAMSILKNAADEMKRMQEPDVDRVMELLDQVQGPAKVCKERIDKLRARLASMAEEGEVQPE